VSAGEVVGPGCQTERERGGGDASAWASAQLGLGWRAGPTRSGEGEQAGRAGWQRKRERAGLLLDALGWAAEKRGAGRKEAGPRPNKRKGEFFNSFAFSFPIPKPHSNMNQIKFE